MKHEEDPIREIDITKGHRKPKFEPLHPSSNGSDVHPLSKTPLDAIIQGLNVCPIGDGPQYEDLVLSASFKIFGNLVDNTLVRQQVPIQGGRADIELPFCVESLADDKYKCWVPWQRDYEIESMLVEVKNLQELATHEDAVQLKGYVDGHSRGNLAFLVSRKGFTSSALKTLGDYQRYGYLLLPLHNYDLLKLMISGSDNPIEVMRFLRRLSTSILRNKKSV
jgi:hypothetical protein